MSTYYEQKLSNDERAILKALASLYRRIKRKEISEMTRISDWSVKEQLGALVGRGLVEVQKSRVRGNHGCLVYCLTDSGREVLVAMFPHDWQPVYPDTPDRVVQCAQCGVIRNHFVYIGKDVIRYSRPHANITHCTVWSAVEPPCEATEDRTTFEEANA